MKAEELLSWNLQDTMNGKTGKKKKWVLFIFYFTLVYLKGSWAPKIKSKGPISPVMNAHVTAGLAQ